MSIKNLRQPEILLNKQWKTLTKHFFALNFLYINFFSVFFSIILQSAKLKIDAGIVARQHFLVIV
jgi:hypothetical protein